LRVHDAQRFVVQPVQTDFGGHDLPVQAMLALDIGGAAVEKSSDGVCLSWTPGNGSPQWFFARPGLKPSTRCH
jgi:hypothetical protein